MPMTRDGRIAQIQTMKKPGMSVFSVFGNIEGRPCHWTAEGKFRMDGKPDGRDIDETDWPNSEKV